MDYLLIQALIEQLENITTDFDERELDSTDWEGLNRQELTQLFNALHLTLDNRWRPCSVQKYPSITGYYLVTRKGFNRPMYAWWIWTEKKWQYLNSNTEIEDVIAWMPLPKPYEEKKKFSDEKLEKVWNDILS